MKNFVKQKKVTNEKTNLNLGNTIMIITSIFPLLFAGFPFNYCEKLQNNSMKNQCSHLDSFSNIFPHYWYLPIKVIEKWYYH